VEHEAISNEELLALDVDILIPAALENQITAKMPIACGQNTSLKWPMVPLPGS